MDSFLDVHEHLGEDAWHFVGRTARLLHGGDVSPSAASELTQAWSTLFEESKKLVFEYSRMIGTYITYMHFLNPLRRLKDGISTALSFMVGHPYCTWKMGAPRDLPSTANKLLEFFEKPPQSTTDRIQFALFMEKFVKDTPTHDPSTVEAAVDIRFRNSSKDIKEKEGVKKKIGNVETLVHPKPRRLPTISHLPLWLLVNGRKASVKSAVSYFKMKTTLLLDALEREVEAKRIIDASNAKLWLLNKEESSDDSGDGGYVCGEGPFYSQAWANRIPPPPHLRPSTWHAAESSSPSPYRSPSPPPRHGSPNPPPFTRLATLLYPHIDGSTSVGHGPQVHSDHTPSEEPQDDPNAIHHWFGEGREEWNFVLQRLGQKHPCRSKRKRSMGDESQGGDIGDEATRVDVKGQYTLKKCRSF